MSIDSRHVSTIGKIWLRFLTAPRPSTMVGIMIICLGTVAVETAAEVGSWGIESLIEGGDGSDQIPDESKQAAENARAAVEAAYESQGSFVSVNQQFVEELKKAIGAIKQTIDTAISTGKSSRVKQDASAARHQLVQVKKAIEAQPPKNPKPEDPPQWMVDVGKALDAFVEFDRSFAP